MSFAEFVRERKYLQNVSPSTLEWYKYSFKWPRSESPSKAELQDAVMRMREKGLKATGCNSAIRAINAYLRWSGSSERVLYLKEPEHILPTLTLAQVKLLAQWKPKGFYQRRLHLLVLMLIDTGCRIDEILSLQVSDVDMDNLLLTVTGKGRKSRRIPFSYELRRVLTRYFMEYAPHGLLLTSQHGHKLGRRNVLRNVKSLCNRLGFDPPERTIHAFRHTFAVFYLRKRGSVFHLQESARPLNAGNDETLCESDDRRLAGGA